MENVFYGKLRPDSVLSYRFNVDYLLWCCYTQDDIVVLTDENVVFNANTDAAESFRYTFWTVLRDVDSWFDCYCHSAGQFAEAINVCGIMYIQTEIMTDVMRIELVQFLNVSVD